MCVSESERDRTRENPYANSSLNNNRGPDTLCAYRATAGKQPRGNQRRSTFFIVNAINGMAPSFSCNNLTADTEMIRTVTSLHSYGAYTNGARSKATDSCAIKDTFVESDEILYNCHCDTC